MDVNERENSFDDFYRAHFGRLVVLAGAACGDRSQGADIAQESMVAAYKRWERLRDYDSPYGWVRKVAIQRAMKSKRKQSNFERAALTATYELAEAVLPADFDDALWNALALLPRTQRIAVVMHHVERAPLSEVAEVLGCAEGTVKTHAARGRASLAQALESTHV